MINKDTIVYGSFSTNPGNNGILFFNKKFKELNINAIYKSFYSNNIEESYNAAKILNFGGFAVSMPYKKDILKYVDILSDEVIKIGSANTIKFFDKFSIAYNTDYIGIIKYFENFNYSKINILGDGGFSSAAKYAFNKMNIQYDIIKRKNWINIKLLKNEIIFNCTPIKNIIYDNSCQFIDGISTTETGKQIAKYQAEEQLKIYLKKK